MGFSDKLQEALGAGGVSLQVALDDQQVAPGNTLHMTVSATGGNAPARLDAFLINLIQATRRWTDQNGREVGEEQALAQVDRSHLTVTWDRRSVAFLKVDVVKELGPEATLETPVAFAVPTDAHPSTLACTYTVNVQADVKGQIDPTTNARLRIG